MGKRITMNDFNMMDDLVEHLYNNEIQYITEEADIPAIINYRDIFKVGGKYYMYIIDGEDVTGFVELDLTAPDNATTEKTTQTTAKAFLAGKIPQESNG